MKIITLALTVSALLFGSACFAQARDPASPKAGSKERGRELLAVLGPRPHDAAGITPLQQQELSRRVRCAATRQEIQDELDFEAAGSTGFYPMLQLRALEESSCTPVQPLPSLLLAPPQPELKQPPAPPHAMFQQPPQRPVAPPPPQLAASQQPLPQQPAPQPRSALKPPPQPVPPKPVSTAPAYTPAPDYPKEEMDAGHEGIVMVLLVMNADGSVKAASVAQSSSYPTLDAAALTVARTWRIPAAAGRTIKVPLKFSTH
jgi:TonB family protein